MITETAKTHKEMRNETKKALDAARKGEAPFVDNESSRETAEQPTMPKKINKRPKATKRYSVSLTREEWKLISRTVDIGSQEIHYSSADYNISSADIEKYENAMYSLNRRIRKHNISLPSMWA